MAIMDPYTPTPLPMFYRSSLPSLHVNSLFIIIIIDFIRTHVKQIHVLLTDGKPRARARTNPELQRFVLLGRSQPMPEGTEQASKQSLNPSYCLFWPLAGVRWLVINSIHSINR